MDCRRLLRVIRVSGRYFRIAHCIVNLYRSVSRREKMPSGRSVSLVIFSLVSLNFYCTSDFCLDRHSGVVRNDEKIGSVGGKW